MKVIVILITSIFFIEYSVCANLVYAEGGDSEDNVKIFVGGKSYSGLTDYRRHKIIAKIKKFVSEHNKLKFSSLFSMLRQEISSLDIQCLGGNDNFFVIVRNFYKDYHKNEIQSSSDKDKTFTEMKHMLDDYLKRHKGVASVELDPNKIKTVIISPKKNKSNENISR